MSQTKTGGPVIMFVSSGHSQMADQFPDFPGWSFDVDEVSASVYKVVATHVRGYRTELTGLDPDQLLREVKDWVRNLKMSPTVEKP